MTIEIDVKIIINNHQKPKDYLLFCNGEFDITHGVQENECSRGVVDMVICYKKLWKLLIDKGLNKTDLQRLTGISSATITKLAKNETVNTGILLKICTALKCDTSDIMSVVDVEDSIGARTRL